MSFEIRGSTARLEFHDGSLLDGATVRITLDTPIRDVLAIQRAANRAQNGDEDVAAVEESFRFFGDAVLKDWDLTLDGQPVPANGDGMLSLPLAVCMALFDAWGRAIGQVPGNSRAASANGKQSGAAFEQMVPA